MVLPWYYHDNRLGITAVKTKHRGGNTKLIPFFLFNSHLALPLFYQGFRMCIIPWCPTWWWEKNQCIYLRSTLVSPWYYRGNTMIMPWQYHGNIWYSHVTLMVTRFHVQPDEVWPPPNNYKFSKTHNDINDKWGITMRLSKPHWFFSHHHVGHHRIIHTLITNGKLKKRRLHGITTPVFCFHRRNTKSIIVVIPW